jgi:iron complex outermembrane receptor protein
MRFNIRGNLRGLLMRGASLGTIALLATSPSFAQDAADTGTESVTVTGTLLKNAEAVGTHVVGFSQQEIKATGAVTTNQVLANIPQVNSLFNIEPVTSTAGVGHDTQPKPVLRNLNSAGGAATLVMIDGHNLVGDGVLQTTPDPTSIPAMVLQRVDVVLDGASSIYGSNAISGIINFITRKNFEGFEAQTSLGTTGNYDTLELGAMAGHDWGSGGAYIAYEYRYNTSQYASDRAYPRQNLIPLGGTVDARSTNCPLPNVKAGSTTYALNSSSVANTPGALAAAASVGQNKCDTALASTPFPQDSQHSFFGSMHQQIMPGVNFLMTASYSNHSTVALAAADSGNFTINNTNPYFQSIAGETSQSVSFSLAPVYGPYIKNTDALEKYSVTPELAITLGKNWDLDILGNYGRSSVVSISPSLNGVQAQSNLTASNCATAGCMDPNFALDPYNLALSNGSVLQNLQTFGTTATAVQTLQQARAILNGTLFSLPGGDVKLAAGTQYDYETLTASNINGPIGQRGGTAVPGGLVVQADVNRTVESVFGEVQVPIVGPGNALPFIQSLDIDLSARYDHYSDAGDTTNPKIGISYVPLTGLTVRGNIGTSFNAPSMADKQGATDTRVLLQTSSTNRQTLGQSGRTAAQDAIDAQRVSFLIAGGSPNLTSQKARTWSFGFDYQPDFIEGLDLSLTRWHVSLTNLIAQAPRTSPTLYTVPAYAPYYIVFPTLAQLNAATAGIVQAGFPGYAPYYGGTGAQSQPYALIDARRTNIGNAYDDGLDFNLTYVLPTSWGSADVGLNGSTYLTADTQAFTGAAMTDLLANNLSPYSFSAHVGASYGPVSARLTMNYSAGYTVTGITNQLRVGAFSPIDLYVNYDLTELWKPLENASIGVNVKNLGNQDPPFINNGTGVANGSTLGRYISVNLRKQF